MERVLSRRGPMSRIGLVVALNVLAAAPAGAQGQPELLLQAEAQVLTGTCTGQPVRLEGNHNTVTLTGVCGSLLLKGVANSVRMGIVPGGSIHVEGSANRVSFAVDGAPPVIEALGPDNDVTAGPLPIAPPPVAPPPVAAPPVAPPPVASLPVAPPTVVSPVVLPNPVTPGPRPPAAPVPPVPPAAKPPQPAVQSLAGPLSLTGDDEHRLEDCNGRDVSVTGNRSAYTIRGACRSLEARGDLLTVEVEVAPGARIAVTGRGSIVTWSLQGKGHAPAATIHGEGSRVQQTEADTTKTVH